jgi:hypothetical protein
VYTDQAVFDRFGLAATIAGGSGGSSPQADTA